MAKEDIIIKVRLDGATEEIKRLNTLQAGINRLAREKKALNKTEKELIKAGADSVTATNQQKKALNELEAQQVKNALALKLNKKALSDNQRQVIANTNAQRLNNGSLVELRAQLSKDTFAYDRLTQAERENINVGGVLQKSIDAQNNKLKELEGQTGRNQRNVGNYAGSLKGLKEELNKNVEKFQALTKAERENDKIGGKLNQTINKQRTEINNINNTINKTTNTTNNYKKSFGGLRSLMMKGLGALGITAGLAGLVRVMGGAVKIAKDFEQGNANLASVLGKSRKEIGKLTDDAKRLGASTSFTASEVSKLQTEFAKLGFNEKEILNATEATLDLAAATGSDLAEAAAIAGATLGGFGLDAEETQRITDVMAKSFSTSALDIEKFRESMKSAAPAARAVGVSVEETTALLGTLANAGVSGSMAGTALRKSFIELNAAGLTLDEGLAQVANSEDQLGAATDLVGKKAASSFLILANGTETTKELEAGLNDAGGAAKKMADEQLDTLEGKTKILGSAWEGLVLSLLAGDGAFSSIAKSIVEGATGVLSFFTNTEKLTDSLEAERMALFATEAELFNVNTTQEERVKIIKNLQSQYPNFLANIEAEKVTNEQLVVALKKVNDELVNKIIIQRQQEKIDEQNEKTADILELQLKKRLNITKNIAAITSGNAAAQKIAQNASLDEIQKAEQIIALLDKRGTLTKSLASSGGFGGAGGAATLTATEKLSRAVSGLRSANVLLAEEEAKANELLSGKQDLMAELGIQTEITSSASYGGAAAAEEVATATDKETKAIAGLLTEQKKLKEIAEKLPELTEAEITAKNLKIQTIDKEISRLKNLGETEEEVNKKKSGLIDDEIEDLKLVRQLELATIDETNAEKIEKERALLDTIGALRIEKAKLNGEDVARVEMENKIAKAEQEKAFAAEEKEKADVTKEEEKVADDLIDSQKLEKKKFLISQSADLVEQGGKALIAAAASRAEREKDIELANLNAKLESGLISQADFERQKVEIEKKAFDKKKKLDLAVIAIDLAKEISAISASAAANPLNPVTFGAAGVSQAAVLTGFAIARSGIQAGIVASQKFSHGGIIHGASHAQGGVQLGNNQEGEGGEAIINKRSTTKHISLLSAINQDGGGVPLTNGVPSPNLSTVTAKFANGGVGDFGGGQTLNIEDLRQAFSESVSSIKVQNVASETTGVANRVQQIEDSASF